METRETTDKFYECIEVCVHMGRYHGNPLPMMGVSPEKNKKSLAGMEER